MASGGALQIVMAFIPLLLLLAIIGGVLFVTGQRAARQAKLLQRLLEENERQTSLLKRVETALNSGERS